MTTELKQKALRLLVSVFEINDNFIRIEEEAKETIALLRESLTNNHTVSEISKEDLRTAGYVLQGNEDLGLLASKLGDDFREQLQPVSLPIIADSIGLVHISSIITTLKILARDLYACNNDDTKLSDSCTHFEWLDNLEHEDRDFKDTKDYLEIIDARLHLFEDSSILPVYRNLINNVKQSLKWMQ